MSSYLFRMAHIVDPATGLDTVKDILVVDGVIDRIDERLSAPGAEAFDLNGAVAAPGFCDMHVHFREPGFEHKETLASGSSAAAAGGFTAVACMPNTSPAIDTADTVRGIIATCEHFPVDVHPIGAVTKNREGKDLAPMAELAAAGAVGFSDDGSPVFNARLLRTALQYASMFDLPVIQHAEDPQLADRGVMNEGYVSTLIGLPGIPRIAEDTIIARDIAIAEYLDAFYHVTHVSTMGAAALVRQAKERGLAVTCDVTPHHFTLTDECVRGYDTNTKMHPPLRTMDDVVALKEALRDGVIDAIASDHAPHAVFEKDVEYVYAPFGIVGLETSIGLAITELLLPGFLTLPELVEKMSSNPRRILRLPEIRIEEGVPANLSFFDPKLPWVVDVQQFRSRSRNSPFHGRALTGKPLGIFNKNQIVWVA